MDSPRYRYNREEVDGEPDAILSVDTTKIAINHMAVISL